MGGICLLFRAATADFYRSPYKVAVEADHSWEGLEVLYCRQLRVGLDGLHLLLEGHNPLGVDVVAKELFTSC
jgi:hypothetical protein